MTAQRNHLMAHDNTDLRVALAEEHFGMSKFAKTIRAPVVTKTGNPYFNLKRPRRTFLKRSSVARI